MSGSNHPVIDIIKKRAQAKSKPLERTDNSKVLLVIEGGGMRGIVSAGMVTALEYLGLRDCFDAVYGASAGSVNGAFFLSGQAAYGTTIYYENINNDRFIKNTTGIITGLIFGSPIMNLNYLYEKVMVEEKILDWKKVLDSAIKLNVIVSSLDERKPIIFNEFTSREELFKALYAGSAIPIVSGPPVKIGEHFYWDASLYESIPLNSALVANNKEQNVFALVLRTRPDGVLKGEPSFLSRNYFSKKIDNVQKGLGDDYLKSYPKYDLLLKEIEEASTNPKQSPFICSIHLPSTAATVNQIEKNKEKLISAAKDGMKEVFKAFGVVDLSIYDTLTPYYSNKNF